MSSMTEEEVNTFIDDLFSGKFNHLSKYVENELKCGTMLDHIDDHKDVDNDKWLFIEIIVACFSLRRYDVVSYFLKKDKARFDHNLFTFSDNLCEALDFLVDNGIVLDYDKLVYNCCDCGNPELLKHIVEKVGYKPKDRMIYISSAIREMNYEAVRYFIQELKFDINNRDSIGESYLHVAVRRHECDKMVELLIELGIDTTIKDCFYHRTAFECKDSRYKGFVKSIGNE